MDRTSRTVIRNARVVDGSGDPARDADVVLANGLVAEVAAPGRASTAHAHRVIDADGLLLTPGWVDVHTHYDAQATWDPWLTPSSWHGVTTAVMGNCGVGFAPAHEERHEWLIELMEGVEDIPGSAMTEGLTWGWRSFPEYMDVLERQRRVLDVGVQIAHGPLRAFVMGDRGAANESATDDDVSLMSKFVEEALEQGALGFSTSRTPIHRSKSGELVPGTTADERELLAIADAMSRAGGGVFQFAPEHVRLLEDEWPWMREMAARDGVTVSVNLNQADERPHLWRDVLRELDRAHDDGLSIVAQVAGRSIGILMCLEGSFQPLAFHPAWQEIAHLPHDARLRALRDPVLRARFMEIPRDGGFFERFVVSRLWKMFAVTGANIDYEPDPKTDSIEAVATRNRIPPMEMVYDQLLAREGRGMIYMPFFNYAYGDLSMTHDLLSHSRTRNGLSDAGAHCGAICDGGMPTFLLTHWARDRTRGPRLRLEEMVARQTRRTAELHGLSDRGLIAPGMRADLNLIDFERLSFELPEMVYDFPANGRRLIQKARGYVATFCNGLQTVDNDEFTGDLPGRLVRGRR
ncbi:MAG: amidohydrolase family protein [Actinobacteria bacterium]|nr:amidohydrolase family protein [Actinomycetota bacterium]